MVLTKELIDFVKENNGISMVGTLSEFNIINLSPRFILEVNEDSIIFVSVFPNKTLYNLKKNPKVCISKWDNNVKGKTRIIKIFGTAENFTEGEIYEKYSKIISNLGFPKPLAVTRVDIDYFEFYGG